MINIQKLLDKYPLREYLDLLLGPPKQRMKSCDLRKCPFHDDRSPSLLVFGLRCTCKAGCLINGREWGSVIDFIQEYYGVRGLEEVGRILGETPTPVKRAFQTEPERVTISWRDVKKGTFHGHQALEYFRSRGVSQTVAEQHQLGCYPQWQHRTETGERFGCARYTIPDIAFGVVRNIELRRDDVDARERLESIAPDVVAVVCERLQIENGNFPNESELLDYFFGARYVRVPGGVHKNLVYNAERVWERVVHGGRPGWFSRDLPYVLVHEGALKALVCESHGYPSVSAKGAAGLAMCKGVKELIIIQDNDPNSVNKAGKTFNAGAEYARRAVEASGRLSGVRIVLPPDGYKAADDVFLAGRGIEWLHENGIKPMELT